MNEIYGEQLKKRESFNGLSYHGFSLSECGWNIWWPIEKDSKEGHLKLHFYGLWISEISKNMVCFNYIFYKTN